ncbi:MAG TPA: sensor histidine kinase [Solirubrobacteraceae bacterium]|nr:sensor histidine kinase [Solirubrobacteraceae bacterium]
MRLRADLPHWLNHPRRPGFRYGMALIWLVFIAFPLIDAFGRRAPLVTHLLVIGGAVLFVAIYVWLVVRAAALRTRVPAMSAFGVLVAISIALTLLVGPSWGYLFTYCAAAGVMTGPARWTLTVVVVCTLLAVACALAGSSAGTAVGAGASTLGVGMLIALMRDLRIRNEELEAARAELAEVAVTQERERFARDLHDLIGHSLSVIALKAELAGRLIADRPREAASEVGEVQAVARRALTEVREAVSGYRRPTLDGELAGARMALSAAGIEADVFADTPTRDRSPLDPATEAVLAWAVREGATNVIRHSGARHCTVRVRSDLAGASVHVQDDGRGTTLNGHVLPGESGNGLAGLCERAAEVDGRVEYGSEPDGGFSLRVSVPARGGHAR